MKRVILFGFTVMVSLAACKKETDVAPASESHTVTEHAARIWPTYYKKLWSYDAPCIYEEGNCMRELIVRPKMVEMLTPIIEDVNTRNGTGVAQLFAANQAELSEIFLDDDMAGIISGDYVLAYNSSVDMPNRHWFTVMSGTEVLRVYPVDTE